MHLLLHRSKGSLYKVVSRDVHWKVTLYIKGCSKKCKDSCTEIALNERADLYRQLTYNVGPEPYRVSKTSAEEFGCQHFFYTNWPSTQDFRFLHLNNTSSDIFFSGCFLRGWGGWGVSSTNVTRWSINVFTNMYCYTTNAYCETLSACVVYD